MGDKPRVRPLTAKQRIDREKQTDDLLNGNFDQLIDDAVILHSARSESQLKYRPGPTIVVSSLPATPEPQSVAMEKSTPAALDDLLLDLEISSTPKPMGPTRKQQQSSHESLLTAARITSGRSILRLLSATTEKHSVSDNRYEINPASVEAGFFSQQKFSDELKAQLQKHFAVSATINIEIEDSMLEKSRHVIDLKSDNPSKVHEAKAALAMFFKNTLAIKIFDESAGFWTKYKECASIVQAYADKNKHLFVLCQHEVIGLFVYYFKEDTLTFFDMRTSQKIIEQIIQEKFLSVTISLPIGCDLTMSNEMNPLACDIRAIEEKIPRDSVMMIVEQRCIKLFGHADTVKELTQKLETVKKKHATNTVQLNLTPQQITFLLNVFYDELKLFQDRWDNVEIVNGLKNGKFSAPNWLHENIESEIKKYAQVCKPIDFEIRELRFSAIVEEQRPALIKIGRQHKCYIQIQIDKTAKTYMIPKAVTQDHLSNELTAAALKVECDDLAKQKVDLVVVSSTSLFLCNDILSKAGADIKSEYENARAMSPTGPIETNAGQLPCRKILFLHWIFDKSDDKAFRRSIRMFVSKAIQHALTANHTSVAFPSIGCGQFGFDIHLVANEMLVEAQEQLLTANALLRIIFVLLPSEKDVIQAFRTKLDSLKKGQVEPVDTQFLYPTSTIKMTILSSDTEKQEKCKKALTDYVEQSVATFERMQDDALKKWAQPTINRFYKDCLKRHVLSELNIITGSVKLSGPKDDVAVAEKEYYRIRGEQSEQARLALIARDIIWAYQATDIKWDKYTPQINARIEDAYASKLPSVDFINENHQMCQIDFQTMMETSLPDQQPRKVIRHADLTLPEHWEVQSENVCRFPVSEPSTEYNEVRRLFDQTMIGKYSEMIRIERVQNKQWRMQYDSYKRFSEKKSSEKQLFHGCPKESASLIIHSFFNRSFAGINGVVYGQGAYFSANAFYSHTYAKADTLNGERCMFLVNVLVGESVKGNSSMKTPPTGFDSTTDGDHIFVTYRDDQAYGSYLIVYK